MMLINTAAADAQLGRSFHIAQSFAPDAKKASSIGQPFRETYPQPTELTGTGQVVPVDQPLLEGARYRGENESDNELVVDAALEAGRFNSSMIRHKSWKHAGNEANEVEAQPLKSHGVENEVELDSFSPSSQVNK